MSLFQVYFLMKRSVSGISAKSEPTTTCLQRLLFWSPVFHIYRTNEPLNNDHLSTTATIFGSQGRSLYTGLTVYLNADTLACANGKSKHAESRDIQHTTTRLIFKSLILTNVLFYSIMSVSAYLPKQWFSTCGSRPTFRSKV
jgi:hypothetical protein